MNLYDLSHPSKKKKQQLAMESRLAEFAADGGGDSGNYFQALASAWYNGTFDTGSLEKGIKSQQDVERLLNRGIVCPDGVTRKLHIDYNSDFNGVEIFSDDYYEHGDHDATIDSRTGQKWGPYDHMEFSDDELDESLTEFAPPDSDDGDHDPEEILFRLAKQWWLGTESDMIRVERTLASMGWEIGEDEGSYDDGGVFVVRAGDVNGKSYQSWPHEELVTEGATVTTTPGSVEPGGAVDNFKQQMANNTELAYQQKQQGMAEGDTTVKHRIGLTVTDPNHPMVSKRNEPFQRTVRVPGDDPAKAINAAIAHYRRKGYKVHDHHYMGTVDYTIDEAAPDWLRRTAGAATGALAGVGASFPGAAIAGPIGGAVAGAYGAKAGYDLGAGAADWVYDKVTGKKVPADKAEVDEELTMKHQRAHTTQRRPDISNSLADRDFDMSEKPNVAKSADGHPTVKWRHHGHAGHTRVEPTLNPTTVQRKDTRPIPSFLKKGMAEAIPLDTLRSTAGTRVKDEVSAKLKQNGPLGREQVSVQQLATISDAALDKAYGYGRSTPGNTFGWQANLKSAAYAKKMIDRGVTDIEAISDAIHKGWNVTAQAFVNDPDQFDDSKTMAPEKLQAKIAQRQKLMTQNYAQLPEDEKEKDRVVARAMLQAITSDQGVAEGGYEHGFADPTAPSLGGSRRKDDEGNSEFDDRQRRQTGMIFYKVDDAELAQQLGLKQTRAGKWYLRTGNRHAQQTADRAFGLGRIWYPESVEEAGVFGFMSNEPDKPAVKKPKFTLSQIRDMSKQEDEKVAKYVRSNDLPKNPDHMRVVHDDVELGELSNELLGRYKKELGVRAQAADRAGDYDQGHEYFKKINRATIRQGDNDARRHAEKENDMMETRLNMMRKAGYDL